MSSFQNIYKIYDHLGKRELTNILETHFLTRYNDKKSGKHLFTKIRGDTKVLVKSRLTSNHFRIVLFDTWKDLFELFPCLPENFEKIEGIMVEKTMLKAWNYTFSQVVNYTWELIKEICTKCLGDGEACDEEELKMILVRLSEECKGDISCVKTKVPRNIGWKVIGLLAISIGVTDAKMKESNRMVLINPKIPQNKFTTNVMSQEILTSGNSVNSMVDNRAETLDIKRKTDLRIQEKFGMTSETFFRIAGNAQLVARSSVDPSDQLKKLTHLLQGADGQIFTDRVLMESLNIINQNGGIAIVADAELDGTYNLKRVSFKDENGDIVTIVRSEENPLTELQETLDDVATDVINRDLTSLSSVLEIIGKDQHPPTVMFGFYMDEKEDMSTLSSNRGDMNVAMVLLTGDETVNEILKHLTTVQQHMGECSTARSEQFVVTGEGIQSDIGDLTDQNFEFLRIIANDDTVNLDVDANKKLSIGIEGEGDVDMDAISNSLMMKYTETFQKSMTEANENFKRKVLVTVFALKGEQKTIDLQLDIEIMQSTFDDILSGFKESGGYGKESKFYGKNVEAALEALIISSEKSSIKEFDQKFEKFALDMYEIVSDVYLDNVLERTNIKRSDIEKIMEYPNSTVMKNVEELLYGVDVSSPLLAFSARQRIEHTRRGVDTSLFVSMIQSFYHVPANFGLNFMESIARGFGTHIPFYKEDTHLEDVVTFLKGNGLKDGVDHANLTPDNIWLVSSMVNEFENSDIKFPDQFFAMWPLLLVLMRALIFYKIGRARLDRVYSPVRVIKDLINIDFNIVAFGVVVVGGLIVGKIDSVWKKTSLGKYVNDPNAESVNIKMLRKYHQLRGNTGVDDENDAIVN